MKMKMISGDFCMEACGVDLNGTRGHAITKILTAAVDDVLREVLTSNAVEEGVSLEFGTLWEDVGVGAPDPLTMHLRLPLGPSDLQSPLFELSLRDALSFEMETCAHGNSGIAPQLVRIRDGLRDLANEIDRAVVLGNAKDFYAAHGKEPPA